MNRSAEPPNADWIPPRLQEEAGQLAALLGFPDVDVPAMFAKAHATVSQECAAFAKLSKSEPPPAFVESRRLRGFLRALAAERDSALRDAATQRADDLGTLFRAVVQCARPENGRDHHDPRQWSMAEHLSLPGDGPIALLCMVRLMDEQDRIFWAAREGAQDLSPSDLS